MLVVVGNPQLIDPNTPEEMARSVCQTLHFVEAQLVAKIKYAMRLEMSRCAEDVCVYCRPNMRQWMTVARYHEEMNEFYHFDNDDNGKLAATCDARAIWRRMRAMDYVPASNPLAGFDFAGPFRPATAAAPGLIPGQYQEGTVGPDGYLPKHGACAGDWQRSERHTEKKYCDACSGTGKCRTMKDTVCHVCGGAGVV